MPVKTRGIKAILEPIECQVNKLKDLADKDSRDAIRNRTTLSKHIEQLNAFARKLDALLKENTTDYQIMKSKITDIVEQFCLSDDKSSLIESTNPQLLEDVISNALNKFELALMALETLECLPLKQRLLDCRDYIRDMGLANEIEHFQNIKELGTFILELLGPLQRYGGTLISRPSSEKITLFSWQICASFKLLIQLVQEQHRSSAPIYNCKKYICERLSFCFKMMIDLLDASDPFPIDDTFEGENHFVHRMDLALDILSEMSGMSQEEQILECKELWSRIEDVFSHAMAIAQVCNPYNFKAITGACQSIISEYENLTAGLTSELSDQALNSLFANTLTDALYRLERKVNVSVLNLVMEVFSDPFNALRKLVMMCGNSLNAQKRSRTDLTTGIEEFDQIIDKSMQIGLFAIASCKDKIRVTQIRNCLAGLESLETELISAIIAFYLRPDSKEMRASVKLLTGQWQLEVNKLHDAIDLVMDSAAYCEVVLDDLQERTTKMSDCLDNRQPVTQTQVQGIVQRALSLSRQISATVNDIGADMVERQTIMMLRELKAAIFEADAAAKNLLIENATEPQQLRVIKRCELILNVVKRLQPALAVLLNGTSLVNTTYGKNGKGQGDNIRDPSTVHPLAVSGFSGAEKSLPYIRTPYTVKNHKSPVSIQPANSLPRTQLDLSCLIPYIEKGREMRTERSIMYKTPGNNNRPTNSSMDESQFKRRNLSNLRQHLFSRDSVQSQDDVCLTEESIDLTDVLEKFVSSCTTLNVTASNSCCEKTRTSTVSGSANDEAPANLTESLVRSIDSHSADNVEESSAIGGGDGPSVNDAATKYNCASVLSDARVPHN